jgi:BlaI family penicillinase repressor
MSQPPPITDAEWEIMKVLWDKHPQNSTEISTLAGLHPQTAKTYLSRLVKKKALAYEKEGRSFLYRSLFTEKECQKHESKSFLDRVFGGSLRPMVSHLVEEDALSAKELKELRRLLNKGNSK